MITTRHDHLEAAGDRTSIATTAQLERGMVIGRTHVCTDRRWSVVTCAVRVVAVDPSGNVLGFTGEQTFRVGARRVRQRFADRTVTWTSALFAETLDDAVRLDVIHYRPPRRRLMDWIAEHV